MPKERFIELIAKAALFGLLVLFTFSAPLKCPAADNIAGMFKEGSARGELMLYSFSQTFEQEGNTERFSDKNDNIAGTLFYYQTAELKGISFGFGYGSADNFYSDDDKYEDRALRLGHKGLNRFVDAYIQGNWFDTAIKYGIQQLYTPLANPDPGRVLPKTFKGLTVVNRSIKDLELHAYYITEFADWADDDFKSISQYINPSADKEALLVGGLKYNLRSDVVNLFTEAFAYNLDNFFNAGYISVNFEKQFNDVVASFKPSYVKQKSTGDEFMGSIDTYEAGFETGVTYKGFNVTGYYAQTGDDSYETPWGFGRIIKTEEFISGLIPNQKVYAISSSYDFSRIGLNGLYGKIHYTTFDNDGNASNGDQFEYQAIYDFGKEFKSLEGLSLNIMYTDMRNDDSSDVSRLHIRLKYAFSIL
ncbi:hypothetical protein ADMFC3_29900 [Geovibrio sp. ADMFC3]